MTTSFVETAHANLYNNGYLPILPSSAAARVERLRTIAASNYSVGHRLREMLLTRILFDQSVQLLRPAYEEILVFEQVLAEGENSGTLWVMDGALIAKALIAATNTLLPPDSGRHPGYGERLRIATQVIDLLLQGLVRTSLPVCLPAA
jgi:hypothetical protein